MRFARIALCCLVAFIGLLADPPGAWAAPTEISVAARQAPVAPPVSMLDAIRQGRFDEARVEFSKQPAEQQAAERATLDQLVYVQTVLGLAHAAVAAGQSAHAQQLLDTLRSRVASFDLAYQAGVALREEKLLHDMRRQEAPAARAALMVAAQTGLQTLMLWMVGLGAAWGLLRLLKAALACFPHARPVIAIEEPGVAAHRRSLPTREVVERLLSGRGGSSVAIDTIEDLDRSGLSNISLSTRDVEPLKDIASSAERISALGLSFTPQQLYALLLPLRRPAAREFSGTLTRTATGGSRLSLKVRAPGGVTWFVCEADTRADALSEAADFIAFSTASWTVSRTWEGYRVYRRALRLLQGLPQGADEEAWFRVRELLEIAIGHDPQNLAAQYQLGLLLRRLGQNAEAQAMLTRLHSALCEPLRPASVEQFAKRNPLLEASVQYDRALCFAKQDGAPSLAQAEQLFGELAQQGAAVPRIRYWPAPPSTSRKSAVSAARASGPS